MPRDITITFDDGTTHIYKGAPDTITPDIVQKRAEAQFGKVVTGIDGGRSSQIQQEEGFLTKIRKGVESYVEPAISVATGMVAAPVAGAAMLAGDIYSGLTGTQRIGDAVASDVMKAMTYQPRSQGGQENLASFGKAFEESKLAGLPMADLSAVGPMAQATAAAQRAAPVVRANVESSLSPNVVRQALQPIKETMDAMAAERAAIESGNMGVKLDNLKTARDYGFVVNPNATNPILKNKAGAALVGDTDLNAGAYVKNQPRANALARDDLGLPEGTPLNKSAYDSVQKGFVDVSNDIKKVPKFTTDSQYLNGLNEKSFITSLPEEEQALLRNSKQVNQLIERASLPEFTGEGAVAIMRELRAKSSKVLNNPNADPAATALANAQRNVAKQIESMIERRLTDMGMGDLAERFAAERTLYAKSKAYQNATSANGDIQVTKLHSGKGHTSYTDGLKVLSDMGAAFPEVFTPPSAKGSGVNLSQGGRLNAAMDILSTPIRNKMLSLEYQAKNASPPDMRPAPVEPVVRRIPINQDIPYSGLPNIGAPVIPGSWREGMLPRMETGPGAMDIPAANPLFGMRSVQEGMLAPQSTPLPTLPAIEQWSARGLTAESTPFVKSGDIPPAKQPLSMEGAVPFETKFEVANRPEIVNATNAFIDEAAALKAAIAVETNGFKRNALEARLRGLENRFMAGWRQLGFKNEAQLRDLTQKLYQGGEGTQLPIIKTERK